MDKILIVSVIAGLVIGSAFVIGFASMTIEQGKALDLGGLVMCIVVLSIFLVKIMILIPGYSLYILKILFWARG